MYFDPVKSKCSVITLAVAGVGRAAGWIYPVSTLMEDDEMDIEECNVPVKSAAAFFSGMCAPDALARYYNPFGKYTACILGISEGFRGPGSLPVTQLTVSKQ